MLIPSFYLEIVFYKYKKPSHTNMGRHKNRGTTQLKACGANSAQSQHSADG
jgi:hypothetical protein